MIYDCFTFYNELELLEIRLNILDPVVDKFVLIENTVTYTNQKKPLYYALNKKRYKKFCNKIIHVVVRDSPDVSHPWIIEHFLMAAAARGLKGANPSDIVLISNLDEIPNPDKILQWREKDIKLKVFEQQFFYYYLNLASTNRTWQGTKMLHYRDYLSYLDAYVIRHSPADVVIKNGGWHFSYMGGVKKIREKMATGSHQEYNNDSYNTKEKIMLAIAEKRDVFGHGDIFGFVLPDELPKYIRENKAKYSEMFFDTTKEQLSASWNLRYLKVKHTMRIFFRRARRAAKIHYG